MNAAQGNYRVGLVRGPVVAVQPHPGAVDSTTELLDSGRSRKLKRPLAADLFCGAGGLSVGLTEAGYDVVLGVDNDPVALETYAGLHPGLVLCRDLRAREALDEVVDLICKLDVEIVAGGPPCQPFSRAGRSKIRSLVQAGIRPEHDDRRDLWQAFLEVALRTRPRAVLLENVPDMAVASDTAILRTLVSELEAEGYAVHTALLRACDHGVPQLRNRFFLVALAKGIGFEWPDANDAPATVKDAIMDLPPVEGGWRPVAGADGFLRYEIPVEPSALVRRARDGLHADEAHRIYDHITRPVRDDDRVIFESMDSSTRYSEIDESLRRYRADIFDDKYKRLDWDRPSRSITAHIARDGYWYIHPDQTRTLTVREAARLQTFPDRVRFAGPPSAAFRHIGNAVPPLLAERVASSIREALRRSEPARASSRDLSGCITTWFEHKGDLDLPWLEAPTVWSALQAQLLLDSARSDAVKTAWPTLEKLDSPERTIESADELHDLALLIGRARRVPQVLGAARWYVENPSDLDTIKTRTNAPHVTPRMAAIAALADPGPALTPVVVNQGSLRVASRVLGLQALERRPGSNGRLAVTRLLTGPSASRPDDSRTAMAAVLELAASLCKVRDPLCSECPLNTHCDWCSHRAAQER